MAGIESKEDFEFFVRLASLQRALTLSVVDPVAVFEYSPLTKDRIWVARMFYDCYPDEGEARAIMGERIKIGSDDIAEHLRFHEKMKYQFYSIQEDANVNNRKRLGETVDSLCNEVVTFNAFLAEHSKLDERSFLFYPSCSPIPFTIPLIEGGRGHFAMLKFNPDKTSEGVIAEIDDLRELISDFSIRQERIPEVRIGDYDTGEGISDSSYRGRYELTRELLRRAGYKE